MGPGDALAIGAGVTVLGLLVAIFMAPETRGVALAECATTDDDTAPEERVAAV
jgi:putative MFS transporter